jgi:hypothetical protein
MYVESSGTVRCLSKVCTRNIRGSFQIRQQHRQGLMLGLAYLMPDCWVEVSEGPATDQLDQGFPWFSSIVEQMLSWYPARFTCSPSNVNIKTNSDYEQ